MYQHSSLADKNRVPKVKNLSVSLVRNSQNFAFKIFDTMRESIITKKPEIKNSQKVVSRPAEFLKITPNLWKSRKHSRTKLIVKECGEEALSLISSYVDVEDSLTAVLKTNDKFGVEILNGSPCQSIINLSKVNDIRFINTFFNTVNSILPENGIFIGCVETLTHRKRRLFRKYRFPIAQVYYLGDFIFKRVFPKFRFLRKIYFLITTDRNRVMSKTETLGRLVFCGFEIIKEEEIDNLMYFVCSKTKYHIPRDRPANGFLFKMKRIGKDGKLTPIYKFRTMHRYAEFLQQYIYKNNDLHKAGKFNGDYRVTSWGRVFRKYWIDDWPMIYNLIKGDIKLVGVRPISEQYLSLYSDELKEKRTKVKPGLVPPYYADMPETLDEIMQSELRYLEAYRKQPFITDIRYFFSALYNIVVNKARGK